MAATKSIDVLELEIQLIMQEILNLNLSLQILVIQLMQRSLELTGEDDS